MAHSRDCHRRESGGLGPPPRRRTVGALHLWTPAFASGTEKRRPGLQPYFREGSANPGQKLPQPLLSTNPFFDFDVLDLGKGKHESAHLARNCSFSETASTTAPQTALRADIASDKPTRASHGPSARPRTTPRIR